MVFFLAALFSCAFCQKGRGDSKKSHKPSTCEEVECDQANETCQVFSFGRNRDFAMCIDKGMLLNLKVNYYSGINNNSHPLSDNVTTCDDLDCELENKTCVTVANEEVEFAFCAKQKSKYPS